MKYLKMGLAVMAVTLILATGTTAFVISRTDACPTAEPETKAAQTMQGLLHLCYGGPDTLVYTAVEKPLPGPGEVLVKVLAAGVNPLDWHTMRGSPYFMRFSSGLNKPSDARFGVDFAGTVEAVGEGVTRFEPGQSIFGGYPGAFAEYMVVKEDRAMAALPAGISFEEGAAMGIAATTALQALRDQGQLQRGQKVLINGASGGVGTFAVQMAAAMGAEVYGVSSTRNVKRVRALGAQYVFDYNAENYTESDIRFDLILDLVGNHSPVANAGVLTPTGKLVMVGGPKGNWIGPLLNPLQAAVASPFIEQEVILMLARMKADDMQALADMLASGTVTPVIDRSYPLAQAADALAYSETGRARGKIILAMDI